jgi:alpha-amylase/alpha-mannosidase (GH57 family)
MIMPLSNRRDKVTQVKWGIADFQHRFKRKPEGMWLPETAVDTETLEVLAENGIAYTILAPRQAKRVRRKGGRSWKDVTGDRIDPSRAYQVVLPSKKSINVFFYDGPISQAVAFEGLLTDGQRFADRLMSGFSDARDWPQLSHIATDGESYGHHHHFGEMALTYALQQIEERGAAQLTNYGQFLEKYPPDHVVEIVENSSWSCVHGVERWRSNCGCNSGGRAGWSQAWRGPLRAALDWLRDALMRMYEEKAENLLKDPWKARDEYIHIILDRSETNVRAFFTEHGNHALSDQEIVTALKLLEMQRHLLLMYTSCGWFFDELSGLETVQVIHYAGRAVELAKEFLGDEVERNFLDRLKLAKSNMPQHGDGEQIYQKCVKSASVNIEKLAGHYAISSLFENYGERTNIYCYNVEREQYSLEAEGKLRLAVGRARFSSEITRESASLSFGVLHLGDHNVTGGVRHSDDREKYEQSRARLIECFSKADTAAVIRILDEEFDEHSFSLSSLFRDEQRKIVALILNDSLTSAAAAYRTIYENQAPLIRFLNSLNIPVPPAFKAAADVAINSQLRKSIERSDIDGDNIQASIKEASTSRVPLDETTLEFDMRKKLEEQAALFAERPNDLETVQKFRKQLEVAKSLPFPVTLWEVQNVAYAPLIRALQQWRGDGAKTDPEAANWIKELTALSEGLRIIAPTETRLATTSHA